MVRTATEHVVVEACDAVGLGVPAMLAGIRLFTFHLVKESACS
ncbi:Uncharacterised protein [Mycobacteroides abscessus]|nr:Uncharacterised protein [Mycobacteroides abscessus]CPW11206.1 Uncharacterised protein [Mycobacteroides abscessus]CQA09058.1 Uncharacterised protein [Mycobacteroides abscessus]